MKQFLTILVASVFLAACIPTGTTPTPTPDPSPPTQGADCGIQSCHGLDISCGPAVPEFCTTEYRLGDFCRQFAECGVVEGQCQFIETETFVSCKSCVEQCEKGDPEASFACEEQCRMELQPYLYSEENLGL